MGAAAAGGLLAGGLLAGHRLLSALWGPTAVSQSYDAVFHLNAVRYVLDTGDGSSLHLGRLTHPGAATSFYPAAWHDVVSLAAGTTGAGVDVATNATAVVVAVLVWPLGVVGLVRAVLGRRPVALAAAGALTAAFTAQPIAPLEWGVLYPTLLTNSLLPAPVALLVLAADRSRPWRPRLAALLAAAGTLPGLALAQPSGGFALVAVALPLGVAVLVATTGAWWAAGRRVAALVLPAVAGAVAVVAWHAVDTAPSVVSARGTDWAAQVSTLAAVEQALLFSHLSHSETVRPPLWVAAVLVAAGLLLALGRRNLRWVAASHVLLSGLYVLAWGVDSPLSQSLTGFWFNDAYRIAGLPVITGVVLASAALALVPGLVRRAARRLGPRRGRRRSTPPAGRWVVVSVVGSAAAVAIVLVAARGAGYSATYASLWDNSATLPDTVLNGAGLPLSDVLDADERTLLDRLPAEVPAGQSVAGNPWNGSGFVDALDDRTALFPHMTSTFDPPRAVVAAHLRDAASDPAVCEAARALDLRWVLDFGGYHLWGGDPSHRDALYPGLEDVGSAPGFRLVDSQGHAKLYELTACDA